MDSDYYYIKKQLLNLSMITAEKFKWGNKAWEMMKLV